ncbi:hypothetical protein [Chenggangzhangella methanolivorans]|uniref:hypothetical protein n=1 Tax=Chenggangzhangella methanolivorans TaxID=1437009 RepID=UPI0021BD9E18|nr:hypothetical protein [Chenggangzhangella methanolivorans]
MSELADDLARYDDADPTSDKTATDPEAVEAIEAVEASEASESAPAGRCRGRFGAAAPVEAPKPIDPDAVLCVGARTPVDQAAAVIVAQILCKNGVSARLVEGDDPQTAGAAPPVWCLVALDPGDAQLRLGVRRIKRAGEEAQVVVARWRSESTDWSAEAARRAIDKERASARADAVALSLGDAVELCRAAKAASAQLGPARAALPA